MRVPSQEGAAKVSREMCELKMSEGREGMHEVCSVLGMAVLRTFLPR